MGLLNGKAGIITGAGRGIAGATASLLAEEGAQVVVADRGVAVDGTGSDTAVALGTLVDLRA